MSRYRDHHQGGGLFSFLEHQQEMSRKEVGILKLRDLIDWESFRPVLEEVTGYAQKDWSKGGQPPFDPVLMFKVLILQKYHGLSDDATEYQIKDRESFKSFLGLVVGDDIPDAKTIWEFKQRLEAEGRDGSGRLFETFAQLLERDGVIAREGSIIDASFTEVPRQRNSREQNQQIKEAQRPEEFDQNPSVGRQKDSDARWTKKNNENYYGYKNHVKADLKTKLILSEKTTSAEVHDSQVFEELLDEGDQAVLADSAYYSEEHERYLLESIDAEEYLMRKAYRNQPLSEGQKRSNQTISRMRVRIEHIFGRMSQIGADYCRSIGLKRASQHNSLCNLVYNMDRYAYLCR